MDPMFDTSLQVTGPRLCKRIAAACVLAAVMHPAGADPLVIDAPAFTLSAGLAQGESLLAELGGAVTFDLPLVFSKTYVQAFSADGAPDFEGKSHTFNYHVDVRSGHHITGYRLTGKTTGTLLPGGPPPSWATEPYDVRNRGRLAIGLGTDSIHDEYASNVMRRENVGGDTPFVLETTGLSMRSDFDMTLAFDAYTYANGTPFYHPDEGVVTHYGPSYSDFGFHALRLTIFTSPVPEPAGVGMLVAGLAVIGAAVRRARRAAAMMVAAR
jgi:hypothetical protein